jgi:hypothetical protein
VKTVAAEENKQEMKQWEKLEMKIMKNEKSSNVAKITAIWHQQQHRRNASWRRRAAKIMKNNIGMAGGIISGVASNIRKM